MTIRFHPTPTRRILRGMASLALLALLVWPAASSAQQLMRPYNNGKGLESPVRTPEERAETQAVRLSGVFRHSLRDGLSIDDRPVLVTTGTTVFPSLSEHSMLPDPADLQGRDATVYGRPGPNGVEAVLVILDGNTRFGVQISAPSSASGLGPNGELEEMSPGTPQ